MARGCPPTPNGRAVNSEAKFLLLDHAFETWRVRRVALCTDARNERSRAAIERIGARFEGILRHHRPSAVPAERGRIRDTALFAITDDDWPEVRVGDGGAARPLSHRAPHDARLGTVSPQCGC